MSICTRLPIEERCRGCPLTEYSEDPYRRNLSPGQTYRVETEVNRLLQVLDFDTTKADLIRKTTDALLAQEPAYMGLGMLVVNIVFWKTSGGCEHHDGPIVEDPETDARIEAFLVNLRGEESNGKDF